MNSANGLLVSMVAGALFSACSGNDGGYPPDKRSATAADPVHEKDAGKMIASGGTLSGAGGAHAGGSSSARSSGGSRGSSGGSMGSSSSDAGAAMGGSTSGGVDPPPPCRYGCRNGFEMVAGSCPFGCADPPVKDGGMEADADSGYTGFVPIESGLSP